VTTTPDGFDLRRWERGQANVYAYIDEEADFATFRLELIAAKP
jgi:hypothetical protein